VTARYRLYRATDKETGDKVVVKFVEGYRGDIHKVSNAYTLPRG
jgi:hypothetical protein